MCIKSALGEVHHQQQGDWEEKILANLVGVRYIQCRNSYWMRWSLADTSLEKLISQRSSQSSPSNWGNTPSHATLQEARTSLTSINSCLLILHKTLSKGFVKVQTPNHLLALSVQQYQTENYMHGEVANSETSEN